MQTLNTTPPSQGRWISRGFESLVHELAVNDLPTEHDFDVVIVGSGYGGSIAARELSLLQDAHGALRLAVLERGQEYLPGSFPTHESELPGHIRFSTADNASPRGKRDGLFDIRVGADVTAILANGLGGGSLINAGVMLEPDVSGYQHLPTALRNPEVLKPFFTDAKRALGSLRPNASEPRAEKENTIQDRASGGWCPDKFTAMMQLGGGAAKAAPFTVSMQTGANQSGVHLSECAACGNCMTGCNFSAKNSLDEGLLAEAWRGGVEIFTGATVLDLHPGEREGWTLRVVHTDPKLRRQEVKPCEVRARRVILAAGTFGTTEILLRSQKRNCLNVSKRLGDGFSGNADLMTAAYDTGVRVNGIAADGARPPGGTVGPTITSMIDLRTGDERGVMIQEFAIPAPMRRIFQETCALAHCFHQLSTYDDSAHSYVSLDDPLSIDHEALDQTLLLGVMGHDGSTGRLQLPGSVTDEDDGIAHVVWHSVRDDAKTPVFMHQIERIEALMKRSGFSGALLQNPLWKLIPTSLRGVFEIPNGPALTVHPLGGCRMGDDDTQGVVDHLGRVFDGVSRTSTHEGLVVLDGSMISASLGVNPALTITAVSLRAIRELSKLWTMSPKRAGAGRPLSSARPVLRAPASSKDDAQTNVRILERLVGKANFSTPELPELPCVIELTLQFKEYAIAQLSGKHTDRALEVDRAHSRIRIFDDARWQELVELGEPEHVRDRAALFIARLEGTMEVFRRGDRSAAERVEVATSAWRINRGRRDMVQGASLRNLFLRKTLKRAQRACASHAGELRLFNYRVQIGEVLKDAEYVTLERGGRIHGHKRFTYDVHCNPWNQLLQLQLTEFPGLARPPILELDLRFLAAERVPLMQITRQRDHATALFDIASFLLYVTRLFISIHIWSFRKPDSSWRDRPQRLAGAPSDQRESVAYHIPVGTSGAIRLQRFKGRADRSPVLLIHGYSANSTTFAHPKIQPNLASRLHDAGRDVWVIDLRTSSGFETTRCVNWTFEEMAAVDIPAAISYIWNMRASEKADKPIDIVAHCMGAAMLSMTILGASNPQFGIEKKNLREVLGNIVLSQVGPVMVFTAANVFRGFAMSYLKYLFRFDELDFSPPQELTSEILDRALATLPYPQDEFAIENPARCYELTRYTRTRHRMDAWFGRVFRLTNMEPNVLRRIDDLFGPVNLATLFQTMHFARRKVVTNRAGHNFGVNRANLRDKWTMPTLSIHGMENGLSDVATVRRLDAVMRDAMPAARRDQFKVCRLRGFGHQDCLIGRERQRVFDEIVRFLDHPAAYQPNDMLHVPWPIPRVRSVSDSVSNDSSAPDDLMASLSKLSPFEPYGDLLVRTPWIGPIVARDATTHRPLRARLATDPQLGTPHSVVFVPVQWIDGSYVPADANLANARIKNWPRSTPMDATFEIPENLATLDHGVLVVLLYEQSKAIGVAEFLDFAPDKRREQETRIIQAIQRALDETPPEQLHDAVIEPGDSAESAPTDRSRTMQSASKRPLRFALGSCQYPAGALDHELAEQSYRRLADRLDDPSATSKPDFAILTGDQVYVDATAGLFDPTVRDDRYGLPYEKWLQTAAVRRVLRKINIYSMLDDHEIDDNWGPLPASSAQHRAYGKLGIDAYVRFREIFGPPLQAAIGRVQRPLWYTLSLHGCEFFFVDSRTERSLRNAATADQAQMISRAQLQALMEWISEHAPKQAPKFIISPSILLPRRLSSLEADDTRSQPNRAATLHSDAWDGYPDTFHTLLAHIATVQPRNLIFLSGDEHRPCIANVSIEAQGSHTATVFHSIHSSPLYAPFPFANSYEHAFCAHESFEFSSPTSRLRCQCTVNTCFPTAADGFVLFDYDHNAPQKLELEFLRACTTQKMEIPLQ